MEKIVPATWIYRELTVCALTKQDIVNLTSDKFRYPDQGESCRTHTEVSHTKPARHRTSRHHGRSDTTAHSPLPVPLKYSKTCIYPLVLFNFTALNILTIHHRISVSVFHVRHACVLDIHQLPNSTSNNPHCD